MAKAVAYVSGVALAPGVSRNNRLYTREAIAKAVSSAQARIADGGRPINMYTHHETTNTRELVGAIKRIWQEDDGSAKYVAAIADTKTGRDIANLVNPEGEEPAFLRGVSIRGNWVGASRRERAPDGSLCETGSDLEIGRLDYTSDPGVVTAGVEAFSYADAGDGEAGERYAISESAPEALLETAIAEETLPAAPAVPGGLREALRAILGEAISGGNTPSVTKRGSGLSDDNGRKYADPGYQKDHKQRYDISTKAKAKAAWSFVSQADNAKLYSAAQLKNIKSRIVKALKGFGVTVAAEGWSVEAPLLITEAIAEWAGMDPESCGSYSLSATNGPTTVTVCSYGLDPADLHVILAQACAAASAALCSIDPDMDGDIDVPGAEAEDTDDDMDGPAAPGTALPDNGDGVDSLVTRLVAAIRGESSEDPDALLAEARASAAVTEAAPKDPAPDPAAANQGTEAPMQETTTTEAAATAPAAAFTQADLSAAVAQALAAEKAARKARKAAKAAPAETAAAAPVTETTEQMVARLVAEGIAAEQAKAPAETQQEMIARLVREGIASEKQRITESGGGPGRKGLAPGGPVNEHTGAKPSGEAGLNGHGMPADWPDKPLHQYTTDEMDQYAGPALTRHVLGARADLIG